MKHRSAMHKNFFLFAFDIFKLSSSIILIWTFPNGMVPLVHALPPSKLTLVIWITISTLMLAIASLCGYCPSSTIYSFRYHSTFFFYRPFTTQLLFLDLPFNNQSTRRVPQFCVREWYMYVYTFIYIHIYYVGTAWICFLYIVDVWMRACVHMVMAHVVTCRVWLYTQHAVHWYALKLLIFFQTCFFLAP